ncbi:uncharacterized protein [Amphiura filiformis]|uniref:uncharacterized protein n=1 Tax=Amphiura filiformis TaxID=82378 RepID=UPI003B21EE0C
MSILSAIASLQLIVATSLACSGDFQAYTCVPALGQFDDYSSEGEGYCPPRWVRVITDVAIILCACAMMVLNIISSSLTIHGTFMGYHVSPQMNTRMATMASTEAPALFPVPGTAPLIPAERNPSSIRPIPGIKCLSIATIIVAIVLILLGGIAAGVKAWMSWMGDPILIGLFSVFACGILGLNVHKSRGKFCLNVSFLVMSILSAIASLQLIVVATLACSGDFTSEYDEWDSCSPVPGGGDPTEVDTGHSRRSHYFLRMCYDDFEHHIVFSDHIWDIHVVPHFTTNDSITSLHCAACN